MSGGGKLLLPIQEFVLFIADAILQLLQNSFVSEYPVTIRAAAGSQGSLNGWAIAGIVLGVAVAVVAGVCTFGIGAAAVGSIGTVTLAAIGTAAATYGKAALIGGLVTLAAGAVAVKSGVDLYRGIIGEFDLPLIIYTPERIFSNDIPLFNINFFEPVEDKAGDEEIAIDTDKLYDLKDKTLKDKKELLDTWKTLLLNFYKNELVHINTSKLGNLFSWEEPTEYIRDLLDNNNRYIYI